LWQGFERNLVFPFKTMPVSKDGHCIPEIGWPSLWSSDLAPSDYYPFLTSRNTSTEESFRAMGGGGTLAADG
jgi:hypothetical protein